MYGTTLLYETDADDGQPIGLFLRGDPTLPLASLIATPPIMSETPFGPTFAGPSTFPILSTRDFEASHSS